jgi:CRISPR system Cascade subunit CasC
MTTFLQLHLLTSYPPSNPNRDKEGRQKTARFGGTPRLRISSQSLKRAIRVSSNFQSLLGGSLGERTRKIGEVIEAHLIDKGASQEDAKNTAKEVSNIFGKLQDVDTSETDRVRTKQIVFISPAEKLRALEIADRIHSGEIDILKLDKGKDAKALREIGKEMRNEVLGTADGAVDIAMFGRMLAGATEYNREAAVQISHPITTHTAVSEDDFFAAMDDLQNPDDPEGAGAAFIDDAEFGSGVFYIYACVDLDLLLRNLGGDQELAAKSVEALIQALPTVSPSGKAGAYAHHPRAGYMRLEIGSQTPFNLSGAFSRPVSQQPLMESSIEILEEHARRNEAAYGMAPDETVVMDVHAGTGTLSDLKVAALKALQRI